jgi:hypothetical protein
MNFVGPLRNPAGHKKKICCGSDPTARKSQRDGANFPTEVYLFVTVYDFNYI